METSINPSHQDKRFYPSIKDFYSYLADQLRDKDSLKANYKAWSEKFNVSKRTIKRWLHFFEDRKLITLTGGKGRGRTFIIRLTSWLKKKIQLAAKRIKTSSKKRINELETRYLKNRLNPSPELAKSVKMDTKYISNPNKLNTTLKDSHLLAGVDTGSTKERPKKQTKNKKHSKAKPESINSAAPDPLVVRKENRLNILRSLDDDLILHKGKSYHSFVIERIRDICRYQGLKLHESQFISGFLAHKLDGKTLGYARKLIRKLKSEFKEIFKELNKKYSDLKSMILEKRRDLFKLVGYCIKQITNDKPFKLQERKRPANVPDFVDLSWDLRQPGERERLEKAHQELYEKAGHRAFECPRCGQLSNGELIRDAALALGDKEFCKCLYIARSKANEDREKIENIKNTIAMLEADLRDKEYLESLPGTLESNQKDLQEQIKELQRELQNYEVLHTRTTD